MVNNITVKDLTVSYKGKQAIRNINLELCEKQLTGIIGPNGAGKSTLLKGILGLLPSEEGTILYQGRVLRKQLKQTAYVEQRQNIDLSFPINVFQVVLLGTYPKVGLIKRPGKQERAMAAACLEKVGMTDFAKRQIGELSGGQLQRVFIARALAQEAQWIFLDEPFVGIDATSEKIIIQLLQQLRNEGKSIVIVHHDLHKVRDYFDQLVLLNKELIACGPVNEVFTTEKMQQAYGEAIAEMLWLGGKHDA